MQDLRNNIPVPAELPIVGNIFSLVSDTVLDSLESLADIGGPIFKIKAFGIERIVCADAAILEELCDEKRFWKGPSDALLALAGNKAVPRFGLFSAPTEENLDWQLAHRVLVPAFGPLAIEKMFPEMHDMACQLVLKWARMGVDYKIAATEDFTRLTLDTIALCSMDYRFNSFYSEELHPFVKAMNTLLQTTNDRLRPGGALKRLLPWDKTGQQAEQAREFMTSFGADLAQRRRDNPVDKPDLLNAMVNGSDPKTGKQMDNELISLNITTFLVAGHETTSGLLSFAFHFLLKNPKTYFKAQQEVDRVLGSAKLAPEHLKDFRYLNAVLRETLRLYPTAPGFMRAIRAEGPHWEPLADGSYAINKDDRVVVILSKVQKDPKVYGDDAKEFNPDRMLDENFERLPAGAWKPFGTGVRACIGRAFSWQESLMVMAMLFQNFNLTMDDEKYKMKIKHTLTIKPDGFFIRATLREGLHATTLQTKLSGTADLAVSEEHTTPEIDGHAQAMTILYGSNTGTCQSLAERLSTEARKHGYNATVRNMDAAVGKLPRDHPVVIVTASYEGLPPDNADAFVTWLETMQDEQSLAGVKYAVYGCGHSDWASTFQRVPTVCDDLLQKHGAERIVERGLCNAAKGDIFSTFDAWSDGSLWPALNTSNSTETSHKFASGLEVEMSTQKRGLFLRQDVRKATVASERRLTADGEPQKRHLEIKLPDGVSYGTGDYLAILPLNPEENVKRVLRRFDLSTDATIKIKTGSATFLPTGVQLSVRDLLTLYVELSSPATKKDLLTCLDVAAEQDEQGKQDEQQLQSLASNFEATTAEQRASLLDILESLPSVHLSFSSYLALLPPLRPRHYSISSSPLKDPKRCTVTYAIIDEAARSGKGRFIGVTGAYMAGLQKGDEVLVSVRSTNKFFHLPADPEGVPVLMFCGGSGIAPFRGFIEERAVQLKGGRKLAQAIIFVGCRSSTKDRLYAEEIDVWRKAGVVDVRYAFSRESEKSEGCKYVQDRMLKDKEDILRLWRAGAKVFTCGGASLSAQVSQMAKHILKEVMQDCDEETRVSDDEAEEWFRKRRNERFVVDVFA